MDSIKANLFHTEIEINFLFEDSQIKTYHLK
jgi:hypothetical protein